MMTNFHMTIWNISSILRLRLQLVSYKYKYFEIILTFGSPTKTIIPPFLEKQNKNAKNYNIYKYIYVPQAICWSSESQSEITQQS